MRAKKSLKGEEQIILSWGCEHFKHLTRGQKFLVWGAQNISSMSETKRREALIQEAINISSIYAYQKLDDMKISSEGPNII